MINKDGGTTIFGFYGGDTAVMRGDIELMGDPPSPPTRGNPDVVSSYFIFHLFLLIIVHIFVNQILLFFTISQVLGALCHSINIL